MPRRMIAALSVALVTCLAPSAGADDGRPITRTFAVTDPVPSPAGESCAARREPLIVFRVPAAGKLRLEVTDFVGSWGYSICDATGREIAADQGTGRLTVTLRQRRSTEIGFLVYNHLGGPTATGRLTFTYAA